MRQQANNSEEFKMVSGHKIFISYKYHDSNVYQRINNFLTGQIKSGNLTPRDYVDVLEKYIKDYSPHYYKAEEDNHSLKGLSDDAIWEILKDKIFDSTLTIVIISPNMREANKSDREQWIPWEVQYSLGLQQRKNSNGNYIRSNTNAMLAIVLPDRQGSYNYYFENKACCSSGCRLNKTNILFKILRDNIFNRKNDPDIHNCSIGDTIYHGEFHSFIPFYKWSDINSKEGIESAIEHAYEILSMKDKYKICHEID